MGTQVDCRQARQTQNEKRETDENKITLIDEERREMANKYALMRN